MNYHNANIQLKYKLLEPKTYKSMLVLSQDMDAEPCKNYELKGELKMQKVFMISKEIQDFLKVSIMIVY